MLFVQGIRMIPLDKSWSTTTMRESNPCDMGRSVMKSIVTVENGSVSLSAGIGFSGGVVGCVFVFIC